MTTELLKSIQDWLGPIKQQIETTRKNMAQQALSASNRGGLSAEQIKNLAGLKTNSAASATAALDPEAMRQDMQLRGIFTRIKYANISRAQRDSLSSMVRSLAAENRLDDTNRTQIYKMVALIEMTGTTAREDKSSLGIGLGSRERTVQDEMSWVYDQRAEKQAQQERLAALKSTFSTSA